MRVLCIKDKEISSSFFKDNIPFVSKGIWYDVEIVDVGSHGVVIYSIDSWWYSNEFFITEQQFRDRKLTILGICDGGS
jgi:hypothetical protein